MAERAKLVAAEQIHIHQCADPLICTDVEWERRYAEMIRQDMARLATMTLGYATELLRAPPFACACHGPPNCCMDVDRQAERLRHAAHIVVKLVSDREG
jgi:hypothetical protein